MPKCKTGSLFASLGVGLVEGYNVMEIFLSQPILRAQVEKDMAKICNGEATKEDVLKNCLDQMKTVRP
jgi:DNA topoisomerase IA